MKLLCALLLAVILAAGCTSSTDDPNSDRASEAKDDAAEVADVLRAVADDRLFEMASELAAVDPLDFDAQAAVFVEYPDVVDRIHRDDDARFDLWQAYCGSFDFGVADYAACLDAAEMSFQATRP